jgi:hypothetical protein
MGWIQSIDTTDRLNPQSKAVFKRRRGPSNSKKPDSVGPSAFRERKDYFALGSDSSLTSMYQWSSPS